MKRTYIKGLLETLLIGLVGGFLFNLGNLPLPWVLGPMAFVACWQGITKRIINLPIHFKNTGLLTLGTYFGLYFTKETFLIIGPYIIPYIVVTIALIFISIVNSLLITKWIPIDKVTSVFGSIPGGLSEMVVASEALHAKSSLVAIFQTVRLITVLFTVPFIIVMLFNGDASLVDEIAHSSINFQLSYFWFLLPIVGGVLLRNIMPAGIVIIPLLITAVINSVITPIGNLPPTILIIAQLLVGISIGKNIFFKDLKLGGKYCFMYFALTLVLIAVSLGLGVLLSLFTTLSLATAMLSIAPGGLIEMVLVATSVGGDPAIVSSLQLIRILIIIVFVPTVLKWYFKKTGLKEAA
ncbi:AbrB family transcriptional regulator [Evansella sp. AB-rgal1]|uniref:AbrB family transcriptional regulator n=1 Tax=Evansella sp. AB-rgal1 TaxID=3242696 RepID=UPI00359E7F5C